MWPSALEQAPQGYEKFQKKTDGCTKVILQPGRTEPEAHPGGVLAAQLLWVPIQNVWREITKVGEVQQCMFNMRLDTDGLKPGGQIRMRSANG